MNHFKYHRLNSEGMKRAAEIAAHFEALVTALEPAAPSREWSLTLTRLEEACFYAKKAMAMNPLYNTIPLHEQETP